MEQINNTTASDEAAVEDYAPRKVTLAENLMLSLKIAAIAGVVFAAFWGIEQWTSVK